MKNLYLALALLAGVALAGPVTVVSGPLSTDINNFPADPTTSGIATINTTPGFTSGGQLLVFSELDATFTSPVTDVGIIEGAGFGTTVLTFTGATFGNGDTFTPGVPITLTKGTLFALDDPTPFSQVTMSFTFAASPSITDFEFSQAVVGVGVPEPSTALLLAPAMLLIALGALGGRRLAVVRAAARRR